METLFEDNRILVVVKPSGADSEQLLPGCYCVHRLDRDTEGVMVYAKDADAAASLTAAFSNGKTDKRYLAVVGGKPEPSGRMDDLLYHDPRGNKTYVVDRKRKGVKEASLEYTLLDTVQTETGPLSLVLVRLLTGRTHQIRIQFGSRRMPLAGDRRYGSRVKGHLCLWCVAISFPHPETGEMLCFRYLPDAGEHLLSLFTNFSVNMPKEDLGSRFFS